MQNNQDIQLAQAGTDPGFKVPGASAPADAKPADTGAASAASSAIEVAPMQGAPATDTSSRDALLGSAVFLVLLVILFFARNAFSQHLVRRRVAPSSADAAGWLLFCGLGFLSGAAVLAFVNATKFLSVAVTGTLLLLGVAALIGALLTGRR
ncbi:hypothetical protein HSX11_02010 [Oxalobacteraceae bacterium]|nr:hypothetical protein [Oxalobacteraceae bacterium]